MSEFHPGNRAPVAEQSPLADVVNHHIKLTNDQGSLDHAAAEQFDKMYRKRMIRCCKRFRQELDWATCDELAEKAMIKILMRNFTKFDEAKNQKAWINKVVRNVCRDYFRTHIKHMNQMTRLPDNEGQDIDRKDELYNRICRDKICRELSVKETWDRIDNALSKEERIILDRLSRGNSSSEIAKVLNLPVRTTNEHRHKLQEKISAAFDLPLGRRGGASRIAGEQSKMSQKS
jgi:RNA polymerase sigma factor (sigma-70 family)